MNEELESDVRHWRENRSHNQCPVWCTDCSVAWRLADAYLSPPAAGPGFDTEGFVRKFRTTEDGHHIYLQADLVAELRAALGTGAGWRPIDEVPVTPPRKQSHVLLYSRTPRTKEVGSER